MAVLVVNYNGRSHLEACFSSLTKQDYRADRLEVVLVDNASTDDSVAFTRERFPQVRIIRHDRNRGFAAAYHEAIPHVRSDYLAFLNNDTHVGSSWVRELVETANRANAHAVASTMVDWDGQTIDFAGGILTLTGHAWQCHHGERLADVALDERPLLFGCAGALLVDRGVYETAGGFDSDYFAYFEDVDFGWRLSVLGYRTVLSPRALTYHRVHGTSGRYAYSPRLRLYERNALLTIFKNYEDDTLARVMPVAVALTLARGLRHTQIDPRAFTFGTPLPESFPASPQTIATLIALEDLVCQLPRLRQKRAGIQSKRKKSDAELFPLFIDPLRIHEPDGDYVALARELYEEFGLGELLSKRGLGIGDWGLGKDRSAGTLPTKPQPPTLNPQSPTPNPRPTVTIVILTALGPAHLPECLASIAALDFPRDRIEILIVDNGSSVDPTPAVRAVFPDERTARVIRLCENAGFCRGNNIGVREAGGEWVFILNDDTRLHPACLKELLATGARRSTVCVGARILDWTGERLDFGGASVNFEGRGFQLGYGDRDLSASAEERPILFSNGAGMLIRRDVFLQVGGFDEEMFAYYEDVSLGLQLWIRGFDAWLSPQALVYHKHHGTSAAWPEPPRARLYERNALRTIFTRFESDTLARALPASLLLAATRLVLLCDLNDAPSASALRRFYWRAKPSMVWHHTKTALAVRGATRTRGMLANVRQMGLKRVAEAVGSTITFVLFDPHSNVTKRTAYLIEQAMQPATFDGRQEQISPRAAAMCLALAEWLESIPSQRVKRSEIQSNRRRADRDILKQFSDHWADPIGVEPQAAYNERHDAVVKAFRIADAAIFSTELT